MIQLTPEGALLCALGLLSAVSIICVLVLSYLLLRLVNTQAREEALMQEQIQRVCQSLHRLKEQDIAHMREMYQMEQSIRLQVQKLFEDLGIVGKD